MNGLQKHHYVNAKDPQHPAGFTLIELLVVMGIIALLVGILVPGMRAVKTVALNLEQKSSFHNMEVGLEFYSNDFDGYPQSNLLTSQGAGKYITGAQILAEALVGRDLDGFDYMTTWNPAREESAGDKEIYASDDKGSSQQEKDASVNRRKGPYIEYDDTPAFDMELIYGAGNCGDVYEANGNYRSPVFTDVYEKNKITTRDGENVRVGAVVLYYAANRASRLFRETVNKPSTPYNDTDSYYWIYRYEDNQSICDLDDLRNKEQHHYDSAYTETKNSQTLTGEDLFYEALTNPKATVSNRKKPFNADGFVLISAGYDGLYGTKDDVTNFDL